MTWRLRRRAACGSCHRPARVRRSWPLQCPRLSSAGFHGADGALEQIVRELLHLGARKRLLDVFGPAGVRRDERQVDVILLRAGKRDLGFFRLFFDALEGIGLLAGDPCRASFLNSSRIQSIKVLSQSSPPRCVSPFVALTSNHRRRQSPARRYRTYHRRGRTRRSSHPSSCRDRTRARPRWVR